LSVLDVDAVRAVTRLIDKGFEAYLVGGCVRDLLLDRTPKDYDIATEARPPQVKRTFPRNCRIIGRRFKLAHLHFHGNTKILECSTFRRTPQERPEGEGDDADLLITRDNEFGTAEEDALRRDFTVNALFLDPTRDLIVDHCKGLEDIEAKVIRTIGDPVVRFREDPVRILRAAKFAGRLGFTVEKHTLAAMGETAEDLVRAAPPRVLEEILRLLRSGHAKSSFELLRDVGAIEHLIPVVGKFLKKATDEQHDTFWSLIEALDRRVQSQPDGSEPPPNGVLLAVMMYGAVEAQRELEPTRSASSIAERLLGSLAIDLRLPRRDSGCLKRICGVQHRFDQAEDKRRFGIEAFLHSPYFEEALQLYALRTAAAGNERTNVDHWYDLAGTHPIEGDEQATSESPSEGSSEAATDSDTNAEAAPRKKRRRRRRRSDDEEGEANDPSTKAVAASEHEILEAPEAVEPASDPAPSADQDDYPSDQEAPVTKKKATRKKAAKKSVAKKRAAGKALAEKALVPEALAPEALAPEALAPKNRARKTPARKKTRKNEEEDLSDVTFPSSDEPASQGDRMQEPSKDEQPKPEQGRRRGAKAELPKDRRNDTDNDDREPRDREPQEQPAAEQDARNDEPRRSSSPRRASRDVDDRGDRRDGDRGEESRHDDDQDRDRDRDQDRGESQDNATAQRSDGDRDGDDRNDSAPRKRRGRGRRGRSRSDDDRGDDRPAESREEQRDDPRQGGEQRSQKKADGEEAARPRRARSRVKGNKPAEGRDRKPRDGKKDSKRPSRRDDKRDGRRDGKRDGSRGKRPSRPTGGRDVDVVPRYRDRRGPVEVIEPPTLDLSAFDVELDPKRVPTFGSIVEGKNRPKKRGPRIMDGDNDSYRPPPPPGSDGKRPDSPPPAPASEGPDTFGDW
jgi:poly(A) polymerase